jgi:hypothetical protein
VFYSISEFAKKKRDFWIGCSQGCQMPDEIPTDSESASESFGDGLGPDFCPLGRRIVIRPGVDHVELKRRKKLSRDERGPDGRVGTADTDSG